MEVIRTYESEDGSYPFNNPTHIVVHYTAGADGVTARANALYYYRNAAAISCGTHYFLGDDGIFAFNPENRGAWTNGNYEANTHAISIEVACGSTEPSFTETEVELLRELVCDIMERHNIPPERVIRHYDVVDNFGGSTADPHKHCPRPYVDDDAWAQLHDYITGGDMDINRTIPVAQLDGTTVDTPIWQTWGWALTHANYAARCAEETAKEVESLREEFRALASAVRDLAAKL